MRIDAGGRPRHIRAFGTVANWAGAAPVYADTRFDLASLTKVFVATVALDAVAAGRLELDAPLTVLLPEWGGTTHAAITLRMLLAHTAGLHSGADYRTLLDRDVEVFALTEALAARPGDAVVYSDLGFIVLGVLLARAHRTGLASLVETALSRHGVTTACYRVPARDRSFVAATERDAWRGLIQGTVHDEKAHLMNGVAGHAGLFGDAAAVARLAAWYLGVLHRRPSPLDPALARAALREAAFDPVLRRGLGWALKTTGENSCGTRMSAQTFGHTGFTGTSIWADPARDASIVFLTNAVHFGRTDIREIRVAVHDAAIAALDAA